LKNIETHRGRNNRRLSKWKERDARLENIADEAISNAVEDKYTAGPDNRVGEEQALRQKLFGDNYYRMHEYF
jgi:hypothetical protein